MIIEKGYAKVNLGLEVVRKREDGYHDLSMVMTSINLYDELYFEEIENNEIIVECEKLSYLKQEDNLVYKVIDVLKRTFNINKGIKVKILKRIPDQAGLGGGSADAAATLRAVNNIWKLNLSLNDLARIGSNIGSDIPFCVYNKTAKVSSKGEIIEFIDEVPFAYLVLVFPNFKSSTAEVFKNFKVHGLNKGKIDRLIDAVSSSDVIEISNNLFNDLEHSIKINEINEIKKDLKASGTLGNLMTGSGSTVYGICLNEKSAKNVLNRFNNLCIHKYGIEKNGRNTLITTFRSSRRHSPSQSSFEDDSEEDNCKTLDRIETKAYAMIPLGYQRILENYKIILTPVSISNSIIIDKVNIKKSELYINGVQIRNELYENIKYLVENLDYGLIIHINSKLNNDELINYDNYLSCIISSLNKFNEDVDKLYSLFSKKILIYRNCKTVFYDSKANEIKILKDAVFGFVILANINIKDYSAPRYTKQVVIEDKLEDIIDGIEKTNFYQMSGSAFNSVEKFNERKIEEYKGKGYIKNIFENLSNNNATGIVLSINGKYIICFSKCEKHALKIEHLMREKFGLKDVVITSIKSTVTHQTSKSLVLEAIEKCNENLQVLFDFNDDTCPFDNSELFNEDNYDEPIKTHNKVRKKEKSKSEDVESDNDFEGILSIHGGGSIFKQYDFIDIANYFEKFFHGKYIRFNINNKEIPVRFDTSYLPHILGIHLIDENDPSLRGKKGFEKLIKGEISYKRLKRSNLIKPPILKEITNRAESSVMIFNDIFNNRLYNISSFDRSVIVNENSKMDKFELGITRRLTDTSFHIQNLLGIGKDPYTNNYFFYTSYIWKVPANVGKKDSYKVSIAR